jgi:hypothetical protein
MNRATGNMYDWASEWFPQYKDGLWTWNPVEGECPHQCGYCYVTRMKRNDVIRQCYSGPQRINLRKLGEHQGTGRIVFIGSMTDIGTILPKDIITISQVIKENPQNLYLVQTKSATGILDYMEALKYPHNVLMTTTIESDKPAVTGGSLVLLRALALGRWYGPRMVTVEPVQKFDVKMMLHYIVDVVHADYVSIGADSGGNGLPEPTAEDLMALYRALVQAKVRVWWKPNIERIMTGGMDGWRSQ